MADKLPLARLRILQSSMEKKAESARQQVREGRFNFRKTARLCQERADQYVERIRSAEAKGDPHG